MDPIQPSSEWETKRWYPTSTVLGDGKVLVLDGACECVGCTDDTVCNDDTTPPDDQWPLDRYPFCHGNPRIPVLFNPNPSTWSPPAFAWTPFYDAHYCNGGAPEPCPVGPLGPAWFENWSPPSPCPPTATNGFDLAYYPWSCVLSDGRLYVPSSLYGDPNAIQGRRLHPKLGTWSAAPTPPVVGGSAVLFGRDKILIAGGPNKDMPCAENCGIHTPTVPPDNRVYLLENATSDTAQWVQKASMLNRRWHFYLTALPSGHVLAAGGTNASVSPPTGLQDCSVPAEDVHPDCYAPSGVLQAELYDPAADTWTAMASMCTPRQYHSVIQLLPSGAVFAAGGQLCAAGGQTSYLHNQQWTYQIYKPPYFFQGPRPAIETVPGEVWYDNTFDVTLPANGSFAATAITTVRLIRPGSVTHSLNFDQRMLELSFSRVGSHTLRIAAPANGNEAPPGYYMLFICAGTNGTLPSEAKFVRLVSSTSP
ncbi:hypothetical protein RAS1_03200 [Phycisphaerae bacterium RAS1]|nr:hypothetical protein RAS1_03200 [Phycisphaerae bacterium RAS1]